MEPYLFDAFRPDMSLESYNMPYYPSYSTTYIPSTSTTTTSNPDSTPSYFWPPGQKANRRSESLPKEHRPDPHSGPSNVGVGRPARRVQRCGVGQSRHMQRPSSSSPPSSNKGIMEIRCWDHGCEGRKFSSLGNYRRHLREKNGQAKVHPCPDCGRVFTRSTARNFHRESGTCGLSPKQLMLQMQMNVNTNLQMQMQAPPLVPAVSVPSPVYCGSLDWQPDLHSNMPGVFLLGS